MPDVTRTFIGIPVPAPLRLKLERLQQNLARVAPRARWVHPEDFHITLAFLGDVPHQDLREVCRATSEGAAPASAFELSLSGIGAFPSPANPRVLWAGVAGDIEALNGLRLGIIEAVGAVGYPPDDLRFHPHVTLGRLKPGRDAPGVDITNQEAHLRTWTAGPWTVETVVAFASHTVKEGPSYTPVGTVRLSKRNLASDD